LPDRPLPAGHDAAGRLGRAVGARLQRRLRSAQRLHRPVRRAASAVAIPARAGQAGDHPDGALARRAADGQLPGRAAGRSERALGPTTRRRAKVGELARPTALAPSHAGARPNRLIGRAVLYLILLLVAVAFLIPTVWLVSSSFKASTEIFVHPIKWIPDQPA